MTVILATSFGQHPVKFRLIEPTLCARRCGALDSLEVVGLSGLNGALFLFLGHKNLLKKLLMKKPFLHRPLATRREAV